MYEIFIDLFSMYVSTRCVHVVHVRSMTFYCCTAFSQHLAP